MFSLGTRSRIAATAASDLEQMIRETYALEARLHELQSTIARLRQDFERACVVSSPAESAVGTSY